MLDNLRIFICDRLCDEGHARIVPMLGRIVEQSGPVAKTPQFLKVQRKGVLIMGVKMTDSQEVVVSLKVLDKKGQPTRVESGEWSTDNTDVLALTPSADSLSCTVKAVGPLGTATVTVKADADLGPGLSPIFGTLEVEIGAGTATVVTLEAGTPTEQP